MTIYGNKDQLHIGEMYYVEVEQHKDCHIFTVKDCKGVVFQVVQKGKNPCYGFFRRLNGSEWIVFGSSKEYGFKYFDLTNRNMYGDVLSIHRHARYRNVLANPTGEYLAYIDGNTRELDFMNIRNLGTQQEPACHYVITEDDTDRWYNGEEVYYTFKDHKLEGIEWISNYRLRYRRGTYDLIFDMTGDYLGGNAELLWSEVTLFSLLESLVKNDNIY